ncbi:hypothetical protein Tco_0682346 [Tanacetum coccineum]|uniref:Uncharacterized protein n=1 Tax=Tanacetum coccineum TaxID=301880 RepID=A0ABQ4XRH9_9ASTR
MENEHELSYETLTRVYLGSYEHYKSVGAEVKHPEPGFELIAWKWVKIRTFSFLEGDVERLCDESCKLECKVEGDGGALLYGGDEMLIIVDEKVEYPNDLDSEDEVASVGNDMARSMASERVGFGTQCLLEQLRDSYGNGDYDEDPYDDDMYEGQDLFCRDSNYMQ